MSAIWVTLAAVVLVLAAVACDTGGGGTPTATSLAPIASPQATATATPWPDPAAHQTFMAWFLDYAEANGLPTDILGPGMQRPPGPCWSVRDSSEIEYVYSFGECPGRDITTVRVFRDGTVWKAEQAHFQAFVGKPSWEEIAERELEVLVPGFEVRTVLEREDAVVVALVSPEEVAAEVLNTSRFTKGEDGLWRGYVTFDAFHGGYGTPEDALIAYALRSFPELPVLGDCDQAQLARDTGKICWMLTADAGERRTYLIGPTFSEGEVVELERVELDTAAGAPAWVGPPDDRYFLPLGG